MSLLAKFTALKVENVSIPLLTCEKTISL